MSNIINFQAALNARRAAAIAQRPTIADRYEIQASLFDAAAQLVADERISNHLREDAETARQSAAAHRPMPAYCDPANETRGAKYEATQRLDVAEIAKRMRKDIAEAIASGTLPTGIKVAVNIRRFSGGCAIDMRVRALPTGMDLHSADWLRWNRDFPEAGYHLCPIRECWSPEAAAALERLKAIHSSYNRDNSDSMSDYFDVNYYGQAEFDWQLRSNAKAAELAQLDA